METITSPVIKKKKQVKTMGFKEAVYQLIKGKKIHRLEWCDKEYYGYLRDEILLLHKPDNSEYNWILNKADLEGNDYIVL